MPTITTKDGTLIYYKDWGSGQPVVFGHGWPPSAEPLKIRCSFWLPMDTAASRMTAAAMDDRASLGRATTWTPTPTTSAKLVKGATLKVYKGAPHGMCATHKDQVNEDLLAFIKGKGE